MNLNLEEFKKEFENEKQKQCVEQAKVIRVLNQTIKDMKTKIASQSGDIRALQNRCVVHTGGAACLYCSIKTFCEKRTEAFRGNYL